MVSRTSQDTGFSRKQAIPQPTTAVAWSGAKSLEASGEPAVPKWPQGHSGETDLLSKAPCIPLVMEMKVRHPSAIQPLELPGSSRLRGAAKGCSQATSSLLFSICIGNRLKSNRDSECGQCQDGGELSEELSLPGS